MPMSRGPPLAVPPLRLISRDRFLTITPLQCHHRLQPRQQRPVQGGWTRTGGVRPQRRPYPGCGRLKPAAAIH